MARAGMAALIVELRSMTDTGANDYTVAGITYWSDDQLQAKLDLYRREVWDVPLLATQHYDAGVAEFTRYYIPTIVGQWLEDDDTVGAFAIVDSLGNLAPAYTAHISAGYIEFSGNTNGIEYFIRARSYDLRATASQIWLEKAGHVYKLIEWKAGSHTLKEQLEYEHCLQMYEMYGSFKGLGSTRLTRVGYSWQVNSG